MAQPNVTLPTTPETERNVRDTVLELRAQSFRNLLYMSVIGTIIWYGWYGIQVPAQSAPDSGLSIVPLLGVQGLGLLLLRRHYFWAVVLYLLAALVATTVGIYALGAAPAIFLYGVLALSAVVIWGTLAGVATALLSTALAYLLTAAAGVLSPGEVIIVALSTSIIVVVSWMLSRQLRLAIRWSLSSYYEAREHLETARERRAEVLQLNQELGRVRERLERVNAALVRAYRAAEEAERRQQQMTAYIGHEMRTPLNLIIGFSEMLVTSPETYALETLPPKVRRDLNTIYRGAQQVAALMDDVLDMASADSGHLALVRQPVELWPIVNEAADLVRDLIEAKKVQLILTQDEPLPPVLIDRLRIRQVLLNLLINAARFTERGSIHVAVTAEAAQVRIVVRDTGRGIPAERLEHIFEAFQSTEHAASSWGKGTGLGPPLSRRLVQLHGGDIGVKSQLQEGSTFWMTLPRHAAVISPPLALQGSAANVPAEVSPTVVVMDEDEFASQRLRHRLEGYHIITAPDWPTALQQAEELRALAVITDSHSAPPPETAAVSLVRCPLPCSRRWADSLGVAAYLAKPVNAADLLCAVQRVAPEAQSLLLVDDDEGFVQLVARILESTGQPYRISVAHTGAEALHKLAAEPPDAMILDMALPVLDGREVLARKAQDARLAAVPVIVVSAPLVEEQTMPLGHTFTLTQPRGLSHEEVIRLLGASLAALSPPYLDLAQSDAAPRATPPA
jgi:signal transduction histidine kinase/CheY-like chemotaxis protein